MTVERPTKNEFTLLVPGSKIAASSDANRPHWNAALASQRYCTTGRSSMVSVASLPATKRVSSRPCGSGSLCGIARSNCSAVSGARPVNE
jgi:hypothetical protein